MSWPVIFVSSGTIDDLNQVFNAIQNTKLSDIPGTLSDTVIVLAQRSPNFVLAGPASGTNPATPTWRLLVAADIPNLDASKITTGLLALARGGSAANLSATGGANQFVKQSSAGAALSVGAIGAGDVPDAALTSNVALLNRNAQVFTGTYNEFVSVGVGVVPANLAHVYKGASGATPSTTFTQVAIENNGDAGLEFLTPNANNSRIFFSTPTSLAGGMVRWDQTNLTLSLATASAAGGKINLATGNFATAMTLDTNQNVIVGTAAIATNATNGFFYIATGAGAPTGVPTAYTGRVAMYYDTTNHAFYIYDGAWKRGFIAERATATATASVVTDTGTVTLYTAPTPAAFMYRVHCVLAPNVIGTAGSTVSVTLTWNDGTASHTSVVTQVLTGATTDYAVVTMPMVIAAGQVVSYRAVATLNGGAKYSFWINMEAL